MRTRSCTQAATVTDMWNTPVSCSSNAVVTFRRNSLFFMAPFGDWVPVLSQHAVQRSEAWWQHEPSSVWRSDTLKHQERGQRLNRLRKESCVEEVLPLGNNTSFYKVSFEKRISLTSLWVCIRFPDLEGGSAGFLAAALWRMLSAKK